MEIVISIIVIVIIIISLSIGKNQKNITKKNNFKNKKSKIMDYDEVKMIDDIMKNK